MSAAQLQTLLAEHGIELCPQCKGDGAIEVGESGRVECPRCKWKGYVRPRPQRISRVEFDYEGGRASLRVGGKELPGITEVQLHWRAGGEIPSLKITLVNTEGAVRFAEAGLDYKLEQIAINPPGDRP